MPRKPISNPVTLFYPNLLDIRDLKAEVMNYHKQDVENRDFFLLFHILCRNYFQLQECTEQFVPIHSDIIQSVLGSNYTSIMNALVKSEYIIRNNYYCEYYGVTRSYSFHPRLMDTTKPLLTVEIDYDKSVHNKLERIANTNLSKWIDDETKVNDNNDFDAGRKHVISQTTQLRLVPDERALEYVKTCFNRYDNPNTAEAYFHYWNTNPMKGCGIDKFGKRVHSVVTNMPKILRHCLRFKNDIDMPVVELDIVNSQPFFLSVINASLIDTFTPECSSAVPVYAKYDSNTDFVRYRDLCANGGIYEYFVNAYNEVHVNDSSIDRNDAKGLIYVVSFSDYEYMLKRIAGKSKDEKEERENNFFRMFMNEFPSVFQLFKSIKGLYWSFTVNKAGEYKPYANNCLLAQRIESSIMFEGVIPKLLTNGVNDVVTVHDCVIVKQCDAVEAKQLMNQVFNSMGLFPKIK